MRPSSDLARVLSRTERRPPPPGVRGDCRIWQGARSGDGYAVLRTGPSSWDYGHRIALAATGRPVPRGKVADHLCRRPSCVEPRHLRVATYAENNAAGWVTRRRTRGGAGPVRPPERRGIVAPASVRARGILRSPGPRALA